MAIVTVSRFTNALENNSFEGQGRKAQALAYAATSAPTCVEAAEQYLVYELLTGAMTINITVSALKQFDKVFFFFTADGTNRAVTFGTGFKDSGALTVTANKSAVAWGVFDGAAIHICSREVEA